MINNLNEQQKKLTGIYIIKNIINNKVYIGSCARTLQKRYIEHFYALRDKKHKNKHLQSSWEKYGEKNFTFDCLEIVEISKLLEKEQYYMDLYNCTNGNFGYNINPFATNGTFFTEETIKKRAETNRMVYQEKKKDPLFKGYNINPNKTSFKKGDKPWNTGIKMNEEQRKALRVPKTYKSIEDKEKAYKKRGQIFRDKLPEVYVYDLNNRFLGRWNCSKEIQEFSISEEFNLPVITSAKKNPNFLNSSNINKCCAGLIDNYKGLKFFNKPLCQEIDNEKQGELLESPITVGEDNQQPSLNSNIFEGSTTNSQIQTSNVEDGNGNTSALPLNWNSNLR